MEAVQVEHEGQPMIALLDPAGYAIGSLTLSYQAYCILTLITPGISLAELIKETKKQFSFEPSPNDVKDLLGKVDSALMMDNERFADAKAAIITEFMERETRLAAHAGRSYPDDPEELVNTLRPLLEPTKGSPAESIKAIVVPHIDFRIGADLMAEGWRLIPEEDADLFIILGVGHTLSEDFFACLDKDFETPIGSMPVDRKFLAELEKNFGESVYGDALAHKSEHSIEFQSLFLSHMFKNKKGVSAVPILLSFPETVFDLHHPVFNGGRVERFISALKKTAEESWRKVIYIASVDFAHIGARFGDQSPLADSTLNRVVKEDRELMQAIEKMDLKAFMTTIMRTNGKNRVCGFPALYTMLKTCGAKHGQTLGYRQNVEGESESMVSFSAMALY